MKKIEIVLLVLYAATIGERFAMTAFSSLHFTLVSFAIANFYFVGSFILFNGVRLRDVFKGDAFKQVNAKELGMSIATGIGLGILILGLLFTLNRWPVQIAKAIFFTGALIATVSLCISTFFYIKNRSATYRRILWRLIPAIILCIILAFLIQQ